MAIICWCVLHSVFQFPFNSLYQSVYTKKATTHSVLHITRHRVVSNWLTRRWTNASPTAPPRTLHACPCCQRVRGNRQSAASMTSQVPPPLPSAPSSHIALLWRSVITFSARVVLVPVRKGFIEFTHIVITQSVWFLLSICGHLYSASAV